MSSLRRRSLALAYGATCHGIFAVAVTAMAVGLYTGMQSGFGRLTGPAAVLANALLLAQFPLLHSWLLTRRGRRSLGALAPRELGSTLSPTTYAITASLQIGATFLLWSPSGVVLWQPPGALAALHAAAFVGAWLFLGKALFDAGLGLQTGWLGWTAAWLGRAPRYPSLPRTGLFKRTRQPIYLGFALLLWTGPVWTLDHLAIAFAWTTYCALGPLHKERRFAAIYGQDFEAYAQEVPYMLPRIYS